jgi:hypothetical protein
MSENQTPDEANKPDPLTNLKSEFSRKQENTDKSLKALQASQEQMLAHLKTLNSPKQTQSQEKLSELLYSNPEEYTSRVQQEAERMVEEKLNRRQAEQSRFQTVTNQLYADYPELQDVNHDLTKRANEIFSQLDESEKSSPLALRTAVREAAAEAGLKPKSKRSVDTNESFSTSSTSSKSTKSSKNELNDATATWAAILGVDPAKVAERAKKAGK